MPPGSDDLPDIDNFAPVHTELDVADLPVRGAIPPGLNGTLYRNGPNPQFPDATSHWFLGDGMLHAICLRDGRASYRNRWVRTQRWLAERQAGHGLSTKFGMMPKGIDGTVANTNIVCYAGRLLALEEAHRPVRIDPDTLDTIGMEEFGGRLHGPFTAHPRTDPISGEMTFFGYGADRALGAGMSWGRIAPDGSVLQYERFKAPYAAMVHDFAVTQHHVLFPILPLTASRWRAMRGRPPFAWEPKFGAAVGVMPRDGSARQIRWFRSDPRFMFHVMNAWEDGNRIFADVMESAAAPLFPRADGKPTDPADSQARLTRWTFDLDARSDQFTAERIDDLVGEFPRIDDRRAGLSYRHGWFGGLLPGSESDNFETIAHVDLATGQRSLLPLPAGDVPSEPVFVPASADAPEGDGWLLTVVWRPRTRSSDLLVVPALDLAAGPVATVGLPQRVPFGFHGNFVSRA